MKIKKEKEEIILYMETTSIGKLSELAAITGKSKSRIVRQAIKMFTKEQKRIDNRIKKIEKDESKSLLNINYIVQKRLNNERIEGLDRVAKQEGV